MKKIFPMSSKPKEWYNYSNYLNWTYEKIIAWESYLQYFSPRYQILNESMYVFDSISKQECIIDVEDVEPAWEYSIQKENSIRKVFCYFPSELKYRQGYLNTHTDSYLCYFAPPDQMGDVVKNTMVDGHIQWNRKASISEEEWEQKKNNGEVTIFPLSSLIMSNKWRHRGLQHRGNTEAFEKENYIIIAKPSSSWYTINAFNNSVFFKFYKDAMNSLGSLVLFNLKFSPARYVLHNDWERWKVGIKTAVVYSAKWDNSYDNSGSYQIYSYSENLQQQIWTNSYPLMHSLLIIDNNGQTEEFITDETFSDEIKNNNNHPTACYNINLSEKVENIHENSIWPNIRIILC